MSHLLISGRYIATSKVIEWPMPKHDEFDVVTNTIMTNQKPPNLEVSAAKLVGAFIPQ